MLKILRTRLINFGHFYPNYEVNLHLHYTGITNSNLKYFVTKLKLNDLYFGHSKFPSFSMSIFVVCFGATGGDSSEETTIEGVILDFLFISGAIFNFSCVIGYLYFFRPSYSFINYRLNANFGKFVFCFLVT